MPRRKSRKGKSSLYTPGQMNKLVDDLVRPLIEKDEIFVLADELGHAVVEGKFDVVKFTRYRLPWILRKILELAEDEEDGS